MDKCDRVCAYCGKHEVKARGLCNACYIRLQRNGDCKYKRRKTNADRIRSMTDEELAEFLKEQTSLAHNYGYECADGEPDFPDGIPANYDYLTWLQQEVADGEQS